MTDIVGYKVAIDHESTTYVSTVRRSGPKGIVNLQNEIENVLRTGSPLRLDTDEGLVIIPSNILHKSVIRIVAV